MSYCNIYGILKYSRLSIMDVESTLELDYEGTNIFLWALVVVGILDISKESNTNFCFKKNDL